jgi:hypothetical protein
MDDLKNVAGYGVGTLAALTTIKSGGLGAYLMNRQRMMSDPGFRATLAGSPFAAGVFGVSGERGPAPAAPGQLPATAAGGGVVQPADMVGPPPPGVQVAQPGTLPEPTAQNVPGYMPGEARQWMPHFAPYDPKVALEQRGLATTELGLGSSDAGQRAQYKMAGGIPLNDEEMVAATRRATAMQGLGGPGTVVKLDIPGMTTTVGSPYTSIGTEEYPSYQVAAAAAAARNAGIPPGSPQWTVIPSGRNTFLLSPPATAAQTAPPAGPPTVQAAPRAAEPPQAAAPPPAPVQPAQPVPAQPTQPVPAPAPAAAPPPPPPPPPPRPAAPPPPPPSSAFDRDAVVPHVVIPEGQVGYPSAAFLDQGAAGPPAPAAPPAAPPAAARPPGNTVAIRNNNPGNITAGPATRGFPGVVGEETVGSHTFLTFDSPASGFAAMERLLQGPGYRALPFDQAMRRWTTGTTAVTYEGGRPAGYDLPAMQRNLGIDPSQQVGSLPPQQRAALVREMATREGWPARAPARPAGAMYASVAQPGGLIGFPSPAFVDTGAAQPPAAQLTVPVVPKPPVVTPPMPPAEVPPAPAPVGPTVLTGPTNYPPGQQMPIASETRRTQEGEQTFKAPETSNAEARAVLTYNGVTNLETASPEKIRGIWNTQRYLDRQRKMDDAEIARTQKAVLEGDGAGLLSLMHARDGINRLVTDFPDPNVRAYYVGTLRYPWDTLKQMVSNDPLLAKFHTDVAALGVPLEGGTLIGRMLGLPGGSALLPGEQGALKSVLPSGATEPATFEENLQVYRDTIDSSIAMRDFLRGRPVGATSVADVNNFLTKWNDDRAQRRLDAFRTAQQPNAPSAPPAAAAPPPAPAPAPSTPPESQAWAPTATWTLQ